MTANTKLAVNERTMQHQVAPRQTLVAALELQCQSLVNNVSNRTSLPTRITRQPDIALRIVSEALDLLESIDADDSNDSDSLQ